MRDALSPLHGWKEYDRNSVLDQPVPEKWSIKIVRCRMATNLLVCSCLTNLRSSNVAHLLRRSARKQEKINEHISHLHVSRLRYLFQVCSLTIFSQPYIFPQSGKHWLPTSPACYSNRQSQGSSLRVDP